jgi:hypothetical protein
VPNKTTCGDEGTAPHVAGGFAACKKGHWKPSCNAYPGGRPYEVSPGSYKCIKTNSDPKNVSCLPLSADGMRLTIVLAVRLQGPRLPGRLQRPRLPRLPVWPLQPRVSAAPPAFHVRADHHASCHGLRVRSMNGRKYCAAM